MKIMITGGSGFIGRALVDALLDRGHEISVIDSIISPRQPGIVFHKADLVNDRLHPEWFDGIDTIIHLAGAPLFARRWTPRYRDELYSTRIISAARIIQAIGLLPLNRQPNCVISASSVGIYGNRGDEILTEKSRAGDDFLSALCQDWEYAWEQQVKKGARLVCVRMGLVISENGGVMSRLKPTVLSGLGSILGSGKQWVSWISLPDVVNIYVVAAEDATVSGSINAVAPRPFRQKDFMKRICRYYRRTFFLTIPRWLIVWVVGVASETVLNSLRVKPAVLLERGFIYKHLSIISALES